jgi:hypothetical protein
MRDGDRVICEGRNNAGITDTLIQNQILLHNLLFVRGGFRCQGVVLHYCIVAERGDPLRNGWPRRGQPWSATGPKAPTDGRYLKFEGEIWGPQCLRSQSTGLGVGDKGVEIQRSRDHGATVPSTPVHFVLLPQHPYPSGLGNNKLRLRDGGMEETGGNATSEKGRNANDESWSPVACDRRPV